MSAWGASILTSRSESPIHHCSILKAVSGLGVPGEMAIHALREETLTSALAATGQSRASSFGRHARAEAVLAFTGAFGSLQGAFHNSNPPEAGSGYLREGKALVNRAEEAVPCTNHNCQRFGFLK